MSSVPDRLPARLEKFLWSFGDAMKKEEVAGGYRWSRRDVPCVVLIDDTLHMLFDVTHTEKFLADGRATTHSDILPEGCILTSLAFESEEKLVIFVVICVACANTVAEK